MSYREYPVRCCCQPLKIFGWLTMPAGLLPRCRVRVREKSMRRLLDPVPDPRVPVAPLHFIKLREFADPENGIDEIAVYSDDRPIEFWRTIEGFRENGPDGSIRSTSRRRMKALLHR